MANNKNNCDGFICGTNIKKGSIPADRLDIDSLKELIKEFLKEFVEEDWFKELICSLGCEGSVCTLEIDPAVLSFDENGGTKEFNIVSNGEWTITIS